MTPKRSNVPQSQDSAAQRRQEQQNQSRQHSGIPADKKIEGPNRPSV